MKDNGGKVLTNNEDIKDRWNDYFERLMNDENDWSGMIYLGRFIEQMVYICSPKLRNQMDGSG